MDTTPQPQAFAVVKRSASGDETQVLCRQYTTNLGIQLRELVLKKTKKQKYDRKYWNHLYVPMKEIFVPQYSKKKKFNII